MRSQVKVFSLGGHSWKNIQHFPVIPLYKFNGVYLNGVINWLAHRDNSTSSGYFGLNHSITIQQHVILSLDLSTETYIQLLLPRGFDKLPLYKPTLVVLRESLCFCYDFVKTHFIIWQMKDFGIQESWIQLFKISYNNFFSRFKWLDLLPLYLSENGYTLILANNGVGEAFIYNCRGFNKVERIEVTDNIFWSEAQDYVESLVWPHCK
jgi:F-box interacting protein